MTFETDTIPKVIELVGDSTNLCSSMGNITLLISKNAKTYELNSNTSSTGRKNELSLK